MTNERQFRAAKKAIDTDDPEPMLAGSMHACVHSYERAGELICLVALDLRACARMDGIEVAATLVHEAVHVWQRVRDILGPGDLGREMEAYAVQNIAGHLMRAYAAISSSAASE